MVAVFSGGTAYVQSADVFNYLKLTDVVSQNDIEWMEKTVIPYVCEYIDALAGTTWGKKKVENEVKTLGVTTVYSQYLVGAPIYLDYAPVIPVQVATGTAAVNPANMGAATQSLISLKVWMGTYFQEWVGIYPEGRAYGMYWTDLETGIVYLQGYYWTMGYEVMVSYYYGYNTAGTPRLDGRVYELALLKSALYFLTNERYTSVVSQGIGGVEIQPAWEYMQKRTQELEEMLKGWRVLAGGWIP